MTADPPPRGAASVRRAPAEPHRHGHAHDPFSPGLQKVAAASGLACAILLILSIVVNSATTPDLAAPAGDWARFAEEESDALKVSSVLMMFAVIELLWFSGVVRSALGEAEVAARGFTRLSFVVLAGLVFAATCLGLGAAVQSWFGGLGAAGGEPEIAKTAGQLAGALVGASAAGFAAALIAAGLLTLRTRPLPSWLGVLALVSGVLFAFACLFFLNPDDDDNIFGFGYFLGFLTLVVWLAATSLTLIGRVGKRRDALE